MNDLYRSAPLEVRSTDDDGFLATVDVTFARFDNGWNEIDSRFEGHFLERLEPGAFAETMNTRGERVKALFNHGHDGTVQDKVLGPVLDLRETDSGPFGTIGLIDTSYNRDLLPGLQAGLYGASYRFTADEETWERNPERSDHNPDGIPERTIHSVTLYEFGPVTWPADETTSVGVRSLTDRFTTPEIVSPVGEPESSAGTTPDVAAETEEGAAERVGLTPLQIRSRNLRLTLL